MARMPSFLPQTLRAVLFYLLVAFMVLGPGYRQIFQGQYPVFRNWVMFKGMGLGVVDAKFYLVGPDGARRPLDRFEVLGYSSVKKIPKNIFRIRHRQGVLEVAKLLCNKLGDQADIRAETRWSTRKGWKAGFQGEKNLCHQVPSSSPRKLRRAP